MINILLCEDRKDIEGKISSALSYLSDKYPEEIKMYYAVNTEEAEKIIKNTILDIVFLELEFGEKDGFELAVLISEQNENTQIFFMSDHEEKVFEAFDYHPVKFIRKQKFDEDVNSAVKLLEYWFYKKLRIINLDISGHTVPVKASDIIYIDTY